MEREPPCDGVRDLCTKTEAQDPALNSTSPSSGIMGYVELNVHSRPLWSSKVDFRCVQGGPGVVPFGFSRALGVDHLRVYKIRKPRKPNTFFVSCAAFYR